MKNFAIPFDRRQICLRIVPKAGTPIVRITQSPVDLTMAMGEVYLSAVGFQFSGYASGTGTGPSMVDLEGIVGLAGIGRDQLSSGQFDGARCYLFAVDMFAPAEDAEPIVVSILGRVHLLDFKYRVEEMALSDALGQTVGATYTPQCPKRLGGTEFAGCKADLAAHTVTGTITAVTSSTIIEDAALTMADGWANGGTLIFTSGQNVGLKIPAVKLQIGKVVELFEPPYYPPAVGDTFQLIAGCDKSLSTCRDKFNNLVNFGGFPFVPTSATYQAVGGLSR